MLKGHPLKAYSRYSKAAAILYCSMVAFFLHNESFTSSYVLYIGNILFASCIAVFIWKYNKKRNENASTGMMIIAGHAVTFIGIIFTCIITLFLILILAPYAFSFSRANTVLENSPAQMQPDTHKGFLLVLFMNAVIGNGVAGFFLSIMLPYVVKRDQKADTAVVTKEEKSSLEKQ